LLEAKILAVADVAEAMSSNRPYRPTLVIEKAIEELSKNKGKLYDPKISEVCIRILTEKNTLLSKKTSVTQFRYENILT